MRSTRLATAALALAAATMPRALAAQTGATWLTWSEEHALTRRVSLGVEMQGRFADVAGPWRQRILRTGLTYAPARAVRFGAGHTYVGNAATGGAPATYEHRLWEQLQLAHPAGPLGVTHRLRLEQRWVRVPAVVAAPADTTAADWLGSNRVRYQLRGTVPIRGSRGRVYLAGSDELFASFGGHAGALAADQNRGAIALGLAASPAVRLEAGYLNRASVGPHGTLTTVTHALTVTLATSTGGTRAR